MRLLLLLVVLLIFPACGYCASISLLDALRTGLANNPGHLAVSAATDAARAAAEEASSRRLPRLTLSENLLWTNDPGNSLFISLNQERLELSPTADTYNHPPDRSDFETRLQLTQPLYDPDIGFGRKRAEKQASVAVAQQQADREALALAIFSAYLDVQRSESVLSWVESSLRETSEIHRLAVEREDAGTGLKTDTLNARVYLSESRLLQISAGNALKLARRNLALQVGSEADELSIAEPVSVALLAPPSSGQPLQRSDLEALELQKQEAGLAHQQSRAAWYPRAHAAASWALHDRDYPFSENADSWTLQVGLSWLLFDGAGRNQATARALAEERSIKERYRQAERQARFDVEQARLQTEAVQQQLETVNAGLAAAEASFQLLLSRYQNGLTPLSELLAAQSRLEKSRADLVAVQVQLLRSLAQQHYFLGSFSRTVLAEEGAR